MTVFTQGVGTLAYLGLHRAEDGQATQHRGRPLYLGMSEHIAHHPIEETEILIEFLILIQFYRFIRGEGAVLVLPEQGRDPLLYRRRGAQHWDPVLELKP